MFISSHLDKVTLIRWFARRPARRPTAIYLIDEYLERPKGVVSSCQEVEPGEPRSAIWGNLMSILISDWDKKRTCIPNLLLKQ